MGAGGVFGPGPLLRQAWLRPAPAPEDTSPWYPRPARPFFADLINSGQVALSEYEVVERSSALACGRPAARTLERWIGISRFGDEPPEMADLRVVVPLEGRDLVLRWAGRWAEAARVEVEAARALPLVACATPVATRQITAHGASVPVIPGGAVRLSGDDGLLYERPGASGEGIVRQQAWVVSPDAPILSAFPPIATAEGISSACPFGTRVEEQVVGRWAPIVCGERASAAARTWTSSCFVGVFMTPDYETYRIPTAGVDLEVPLKDGAALALRWEGPAADAEAMRAEAARAAWALACPPG